METPIELWSNTSGAARRIRERRMQSAPGTYQKNIHLNLRSYIFLNALLQ